MFANATDRVIGCQMVFKTGSASDTTSEKVREDSEREKEIPENRGSPCAEFQITERRVRFGVLIVLKTRFSL